MVWHCAEAQATQKQESIESISNIIFNVVGKDDEVVIKVGEIHLERRALICLKPQMWLNSQVIDAYMELLQIRNDHNGGKFMFFSTHFYHLVAKRAGGYNFRKGLAYVRNKNVFDMDMLVIPMNQNENHWVMVVVNIKEKRIEFYDPLQQRRTIYTEMFFMQKWFAELAALQNFKTVNIQAWGSQMMTNVPLQKDINNCGVYVCHFAEFLSRGVPLVIDQDNLEYLRNQILVDLYNGTINSKRVE